MKNRMNVLIGGTLALLILFLFLGCEGYKPLVKRGPAGIGTIAKDYDIISPIRVEANIGFNRLKYSTTFDALIAKAQEMGGDDVVNITIDYKYYYLFGLFPLPRQILINGLVIKYKDADAEFPVEGSSGNYWIGAPVPRTPMQMMGRLF